MIGNVPIRFASHVVERPEHLGIGGRDYEKYNDLAASLVAIGPSKSIRLDIREVAHVFGKSWKQNIRTQMNRRGIRHVRIATKDETVHFWKNIG